MPGRPGSKIVTDKDPGTKHPTESRYVGKEAAEKTYQALNINFSTNDTNFTFTPGRVAKHVFNKYKKDDTKNYKVFCYYTDWSQYDARYGANLDDAGVNYKEGGRGTDIMRLKEDCPFEKIVIGFAGIIGDQGEKKVMIKKAARGKYIKNKIDCVGFGILDDVEGAQDDAETQTAGPYEPQYQNPSNLGKVTFTDPWGDVLSYMNCGFPAYLGEDATRYYSENTAHGVLGALRKIKDSNPNLTISLSLGGWTMSQAFHNVAKDQDSSQRLADTLKHITDKFPMFEEIDVDWEYPGSAGNAVTTQNVLPNDYGAEDPENFAQLIRKIREKLPKIKISIATSAVVDKLKAADIPLLIDAGVDHLNLMSYDFFGTPWASKIMHHTNLKRDLSVTNKKTGRESETKLEENNSTDDAIQYLIKDLRIDPKQIFVGYAGYTRNAKQVKTIAVTETTALKGTYNNTISPSDQTLGSFESGSTEWPDIIYNYLNLEDSDKKGELSGFKLYTDKVSDADFLYNEQSKVFMSLDTPRSVKAKGEYVVQYDLAGMFIWTGDADNGLLTNAAREGLGFEVEGQETIDMKPFYFEGHTTLNIE